MIGKSVNVLVVDDHLMVCETTASSINLPPKNRFCAITMAEALAICKSTAIDIAIIDARMPPESGIALIGLLHKSYPAMKIIGITTYAEEATLLEFTHAGVMGILLKGKDGKQKLNECIDTVSKGETYFSESVRAILEKQITSAISAPIQFTEKELKIMRFLSQGKSSKEIAEAVGLTPYTLDDYRRKLIKRTGTKNTTELISYAHRNGLL